MKRIAWVFWIFLLALTGLWLLADTLLPAQRGYFDFRTVWVQYTGVIAMGVMSLAVLLAVRRCGIVRMKHLSQNATPDAPTIDLFHTTADVDPAAIDKLRADAQAAGVHLHLFVDRQDGRLTGERLRQTVPGWREASVWFCGPAGFGQALRADLLAQGLPADAFHQELFEMR